MIEVKSISKKFEDNEVLSDINSRFERGKTNLIIGQSGSGKTVFLKCLLGLYNIDSGEIKYDGKNVKLSFTEKEKVFDPDDVYGDAPNPTIL